MRIRRRHTDAPPKKPSTLEYVRGELAAMIEYAADRGISVPASLVEKACELGTSCKDGRELWSIHSALAKLVAPATPQAILVLKDEAPKKRASILGPVLLIRRLMLFALGTLCVFVFILAVGGDTLEDIATQDPTAALAATNQSIAERVGIALALLASAGLGASFAALYRASRFVDRGVFDPRYEASYWINIVLGLIAGLVLAELLPANFQGLGNFGKPLLALLGGFSATAVYRILTRVVQAVESLVQQDADEILAQRERQIREEAANDTMSARMGLAAKVIDFRAQLASAGVAEEKIRSLTDDLLNDLLPDQAG